MFRVFLCVLTALSIRIQTIGGITETRLPDIFFLFGSGQGDTVAAPDDDAIYDVTISNNFPICGSTSNRLHISTNGIISFNGDIKQYSAANFPTPDNTLVAPYWANVDTLVNTGRIYYRQTTDPTLRLQASLAITSGLTSQGLGDFQAAWLFIATWHNVTYYGGNSTTPVHSFQLVLATDGIHSFAIFNYGNMTWTHGADSEVPALVGYNCADGVNYRTVPSSRTDDIINISSQTNVATRGRFIYRLDGGDDTGCIMPSMSATVPPHSCPTLSGPTVMSRLWIEFYCTINTTVSDSRARFNVTFFSGTDAIYTATATTTSRSVTLHERYLFGCLGKRLSCGVVSYWSGSPEQRSPVIQSANDYLPGIEVFGSPFGVTETDPEPLKLVIKSTLPITCQQLDAGGQPTNCQMSFSVLLSSNDIAVRQRFLDSTSKQCTLVYHEADWVSREQRAYNRTGSLEIRAKIDLYVTSPRPTRIMLRSPLLTLKSINGTVYKNIWTDYEVTVAQVLHYDSPSALGKCTSGGDPHVMTFDGVIYTALTIGEFVYARSTYGLPFEVQVRHGPCPQEWGKGTACICGVVMREDDSFLGVDMCQNAILHYISNNAKNMPGGAGITISQDGYSLKILMPSGGKILANVYEWGMNIEIYVPVKIRTVGLCGSFDNNPGNDLKYQHNSSVATLETDGLAHVDFLESWRVIPSASIFAGHIIKLPRGDPTAETPLSFCTCAIGEDVTCGGFAVADNSSSVWEPNKTATPEALSGSTRRKRATDYGYQPLFNQSSTYQNPGQWPTRSGVTMDQARQLCTNRIVTSQIMGPTCYSRLASANVTAQIVSKCVSDFRIKDNLNASADDKVPELQRACINELVTRNRSDISNTSQVIERVVSVLPSVTKYTCEPFDCSGHGSCVDGRCVCNADYTGTDCAVARSSVPSVVQLLDPPVCNIRTSPCQSVAMVTANRTSNVTCRMMVDMFGGRYTSLSMPGQVTSLMTTTCPLPLEPQYNVNFTDRQQPGSDFDHLPYGGAYIRYGVSISNDGKRYSAEMSMWVADPKCWSCRIGGCSYVPDTCHINGYCFSKFDRNPYNPALVCLPSMSTSQWSSDQQLSASTTESSTNRATTGLSQAGIVAISVIGGVVLIVAIVGITICCYRCYGCKCDLPCFSTGVSYA